MPGRLLPALRSFPSSRPALAALAMLAAVAGCKGAPSELEAAHDAGAPTPAASAPAPSTDAAPADAAGPAPTPAGLPVPDGGRADVRDFCRDAYGADEARMKDKCSPRDLALTQNLGRIAQGTCVQDLESALTPRPDARVSFDHDAARQCIQTLRDKPSQRTSDTDTLFSHEPCDKVLVGLQAEGKACRFSVDCKAGLSCEGYAVGVDGVCKKPPKVGEACLAQRFGSSINEPAAELHHPACAAGAYCDGKTCQATLGAGKPCKPSSFYPSCASGLTCVGGVCGTLGPDGAACKTTADCVFGLVCEQAGGESHCAAKRAAGAPCTQADACKGRCDDLVTGDAGTAHPGHCTDVCGSG